MNEALKKVSGIKFLPLFPLPAALMPGELLPLHIFEPRYRQMLADIQLENNLFGLSYFDPPGLDSMQPEIGSVGCVAEVRETQTMEDGRSNILTVGVIRYRIEGYAERGGEPYLVAEVSFFEDEAENKDELNRIAGEVYRLFARMMNAAQELSDRKNIPLPDISQAPPEPLSFLIAAAFNFDAAIKYELLQMRSTSERLDRLGKLLEQSVSRVEENAELNKIAKTNGHSKKGINL